MSEDDSESYEVSGSRDACTGIDLQSVAKLLRVEPDGHNQHEKIFPFLLSGW